MECRELQSDAEIAAAFGLAAQLRERIRPSTFCAEVRRQQADGYRLYGGFVAGELVVLAGVRPAHTLARGEHWFVDDLVTAAEARGHGHGRRFMRWLARRARAAGIERIYLDSRATARGFYARLGFTFLSGIPCWIETAALAAPSPEDDAS